MSFDTAVKLLSLPRELGTHPEDGKPVLASIGPYGPYVKHDKSFRSIPKTGDVLTIDLAAAVELIKQPKGTRAAPTALRDLGKHPDDDALIQIFEGRFGPYVRHGDVFASLPKDRTIESVQLDEALIWIAERAALGPSKKKGRGRGGFRKRPPHPKVKRPPPPSSPRKRKRRRRRLPKRSRPRKRLQSLNSCDDTVADSCWRVSGRLAAVRTDCCAAAKGIDIREHGSKNIGATNVTRVLGWKWGAACFVLDVLKGALPIAFPKMLFALGDPNRVHWLVAAGLLAILGHMFPIWLGFHGGKESRPPWESS